MDVAEKPAVSKPLDSCDGCTACCKIMKVRELDKAANIWCQHCIIGTGCGIYDERPDSCRVYECLWLKTQRGGQPLAPGLRPDRSRVVIGTTNNGEDVILYVGTDRPDAWRRGEPAKLVADLRAKGITVLVNCGETLERA